ncbi:MAG: hypothetical protein ACRDTU_15540 [Micromonosporaceae bacterium]
MISPQSAWRTLRAWQYKNPEANEPSEAAYATERVVSGFALVVLILLGIFLASNTDDWERDRQEQQYQDCLEENDDDEGLLSPEDWCENLSPSPENP